MAPANPPVTVPAKAVGAERLASIEIQGIQETWKGSSARLETSLHQIAPYVGKMKSTMARALVASFTKPGDTVWDPFCGSGTIALEAWVAGRNVFATDLNPYAVCVARGKLVPYRTARSAKLVIDRAAKEAQKLVPSQDLRHVPRWVRSFFHRETLREVLAWVEVLGAKRNPFLLANLLGILHHQRPGFLSFPSSHAIPYLRTKKFPRDEFPELYSFRGVQERLERKVGRSLRRVPRLDYSLQRICRLSGAAEFFPPRPVNAILTSPPYMSQLDYGRDNRLRLWFLGAHDPDQLDAVVSPSQMGFFALLRRCLPLWSRALVPDGRCVLVVGDVFCSQYKTSLPQMIETIATSELGCFRLETQIADLIPDKRRVRRECRGSRREAILVLRKLARRERSNGD